MSSYVSEFGLNTEHSNYQMGFPSFLRSCSGVCVLTNEMHIFLWIAFIFFVKCSTCFELSLVHHQEQLLKICTNCTVQLIKSCSWWWTNDSSKHVEPFNEKIKAIHENTCIYLVYTHIAIECTVNTASYWGIWFFNNPHCALNEK